jgi:Concanavalin A-like lectin/glucanases superfamily
MLGNNLFSKNRMNMFSSGTGGGNINLFSIGSGNIIQLYGVVQLPATPTFSLPFGTATLPTSDVYGSTLTPNDNPTMYQDPKRGYVLSTGSAGGLVSSYFLQPSYTKTAWVYITEPQSQGSIIADITDSSSFPNSLYIDGTTLYDQNTTVGSVSGPTIPLNTWVHCASTYNLSTQTTKIYKNGILARTSPSGRGPPFYGSQIVIGEQAMTYFLDRIILDFSNPLTNSYIDNVILYNRVLSDAEVMNVYKNTLGNP